MASNVTAKDKKQIKVLGIIVAALLVVLVVVLAIPAPKKQYTQEQMAALAVKYVAENNYIAGDAKWPDLDDWQVKSANNSYAASCTVQVANDSGIYAGHSVEGLAVYDSDTEQWHVSNLLIDGVGVIRK